MAVWREQKDPSPYQALVQPDREGKFWIEVANPTEKAQRVQKGSQRGHIQPLDEEETELTIASLGTVNGNPDDGLEKDGRYQRHVMAKAKAKGPKDDERLEELKKKIQTGTILTVNEKEEYLQRKFKLRTNPLLAEKANLAAATATLMKFWDLFSHDGSYGKTHLLKFKIHTQDVPPIKNRYRPISPDLQDDLKKQIQQWLKEDVIEPSDSPWSSNLVPVRKKNGKIRWCVDWRRLNSVTHKDSWPMPAVQDTIGRLAGSRIFSGIDMAGAFHCVELDKGSRPKTSFATPMGTYQWKRLGFGLSNGPACYCRLVQKIIGDIPNTVAVGFMDDGVVHSRTIREHCRNLEVTLAAYQQAGLRLSPDKCDFFRESLVFLGHHVDHRGIQPPANYKDAVAKWNMPRTKAELRSFVGITGYYRQHIPDYAAIAKPLTDVMAKTNKEEEKKPLKSNPEMEAAFKTLRQKLISAPILGFPYFQGAKAGTFILDTDYSSRQIAGVLSQVQEGKEVVIAYGSKKCNQAQSSYGSTKGELMAAMHFMDRFRYYLRLRDFVWRTDNDALKTANSMTAKTHVMQRWLQAISEFTFTVQHRAGKKHCNADALSRAGHAEEPDNERQDLGCYALEHQEKEDDDLRHILNTRRDLGWDKEELRKQQQKDEVLGTLKRHLEKDSRPDKLEIRKMSRVGVIYTHVWDLLTLDDDGLIKYITPNKQFAAPRKVPCLPEKLWRKAILHAHAQVAHKRVDATVTRLQKQFYFPGMAAEVSHVLKTCIPCQQSGKKGPDQRHTLVAPLTGHPWQVLHLDLYGPLAKSRKSGAQYLLTCRDAYTKWVEAFPLQTATARNIVTKLQDEVFFRYGYPDQIHTDMGAQFTSHLFSEAMDLLGILQTNTTGYNPKGNAQVERFHRDLGAMLERLTCNDPFAWEDVLPAALWAQRTTPCSTTKLAPYQILFGHDIRQPIDQIFGNPEDIDVRGKNHADFLTDMKERHEQIRKYIHANAKTAIIRHRRRYHQKAKTFKPGQKVWLFTPKVKKGMPKKLLSPWTGPWIIMADIINEVMVRIAPDPEWAANCKVRASPVVSIDRLKLYQAGPPTPPDENHDLDMEGDEFAEVIRLPNTNSDNESSDDEEIGIPLGLPPAPDPPAAEPVAGAPGGPAPPAPGGPPPPAPGGPPPGPEIPPEHHNHREEEPPREEPRQQEEPWDPLWHEPEPRRQPRVTFAPPQTPTAPPITPTAPPITPTAPPITPTTPAPSPNTTTSPEPQSPPQQQNQRRPILLDDLFSAEGRESEKQTSKRSGEQTAADKIEKRFVLASRAERIQQRKRKVQETVTQAKRFKHQIPEPGPKRDRRTQQPKQPKEPAEARNQNPKRAKKKYITQKDMVKKQMEEARRRAEIKEEQKRKRDLRAQKRRWRE